MEVYPSSECDLNGNGPFEALAFEMEPESGLSEFIWTESFKLREKVLLSPDDPNRGAFLEYFDSSEAQYLVKSTLELMFYSQFDSSNFLKKVEHFEEKMKESVAKCEDFKKEFYSLSPDDKTVNWTLFGTELGGILKQMDHILAEMELDYDMLMNERSHGATKIQFEEKRSRKMLNDSATGGDASMRGKLRKLLLERQLEFHMVKISEAMSFDISFLVRLWPTSIYIRSCKSWLSKKINECIESGISWQSLV